MTQLGNEMLVVLYILKIIPFVRTHCSSAWAAVRAKPQSVKYAKLHWALVDRDLSCSVLNVIFFNKIICAHHKRTGNVP